MTLTPERLAELRQIASRPHRSPWFVVSDLPAYAIGAGDQGYRVVQTPNQNNFRRYGASYDWNGIPNLALAEHIAAFSPDTVLSLLDEIDRLKRQAGPPS